MRTDVIKRHGYPTNIAGDELALSMSSYPQTVRYLAERLQDHGEVVCELCCGIGISLIELSKVFRFVVGIDSSSAILADCKVNLKNAGVQNHMLIQADVSQVDVLDDIQADVVIYAIPFWDGNEKLGHIETTNPDLAEIISNIRKRLTRNIVIYAPPTMTYTEAFLRLGPCEYNEVYIDGRHDRNYIFLGDIIKQLGRTRTELFY